jgi:hypothetical protein
MQKTFEKNTSFLSFFDVPLVYLHDESILPGFEHVLPFIEGVLRYDRELTLLSLGILCS